MESCVSGYQFHQQWMLRHSQSAARKPSMSQSDHLLPGDKSQTLVFVTSSVLFLRRADIRHFTSFTAIKYRDQRIGPKLKSRVEVHLPRRIILGGISFSLIKWICCTICIILLTQTNVINDYFCRFSPLFKDQLLC